MNPETYRKLLAEEFDLYGRLLALMEREHELVRRLRQEELETLGRRKQRLLDAIARIDRAFREGRPLPADKESAALKNRVIDLIRSVSAAQQMNAEFAAATLARVTGKIKDVRQQIKIGETYRLPKAPVPSKIDFKQ